MSFAISIYSVKTNKIEFLTGASERSETLNQNIESRKKVKKKKTLENIIQHSENIY